MNTSRCRFPVLLLALLALLDSAGLAMAVPQQIDYQGKLTDSAGTLLDGTYSMVFRIWNQVTNGSVLWAETQAVVNVESGLFHVNLGAGYPIEEDLFRTDGLYLSIQVGADAQMIPRLPLQSVPYALVAEFAESAVGTWNYNFPNHYLTSGYVGIGTANPSEQLHVMNPGGYAKMKIESGNGDADLVIAATGANNPSVEFHRNGVYGGAVGFDSTRTNMFIYHNGSVVVKDGKLGIGTFTPTNSLEVNGTVKVTGQCQGTFPRPNYDSGWLSYANGEDKTINHNLGGDTDDYVVDIQGRSPLPAGYGVNNSGIGGLIHPDGTGYGFYYRALNATSMTVRRLTSDSTATEIRVRIWKYN